MSLEFSHYPLTPSHHLHYGFSTLGRTVHLMRARKFIARRLGEPRGESLCRRPLLNQFTGREPRAQRYDYCYGEAGVLVARLSNLTNASGAGGQIER